MGKRDFSCLTPMVGQSIAFPADKKRPLGVFGRGDDGWNLAAFGMFVTDGCDVISREITDVQCATGGQSCGAVWVGDGNTDTAHGICDWCNEHNSTGRCDVQFTLAETH